jgi:predicted transcriptional regulator of viral defense system
MDANRGWFYKISRGQYLIVNADAAREAAKHEPAPTASAALGSADGGAADAAADLAEFTRDRS